MVKVYYNDDVNTEVLKGKTVAVIGYGSQGHAHALNLRDSGHQVVVGLQQGKSWVQAEEDRCLVLDSDAHLLDTTITTALQII